MVTNKIRYGVIPAAGKGTRMGTLTRAVPKELIPVGGKPSIQYAVENMAKAGIEKIFIITGWRKHAILDFLGSGKDFGVDIAYIVQDREWGLAKAIARTKSFIDEPFLVNLGDDIFSGAGIIRSLIDAHFEKEANATIGIEEVEDYDKYGVVFSDESNKISKVVEKPKKDKTLIRDVASGIYVFDQTIFDAIEKTKPTINNEYQLAETLNIMIKEGFRVFSKKIEGQRVTMGCVEDLRIANEFFYKFNDKQKRAQKF